MSRSIVWFILPALFFFSAATHPLPTLTGQASCQANASDSRFWEPHGSNYQLSLGPTKVTIIGRRTWGAAPALPQGRSWEAYSSAIPLCEQLKRVTIHHTHSSYTPLSLQHRHQTQKDPKADIGYHFFIDHAGDIYEGRPLGIIGSHSESDNRGNVGIALNGDFQETPPSRAQMETLKQLVTALQCPCQKWDGIWSHRERKSLRFPEQPEHHTLCPGDVLATEVTALHQHYLENHSIHPPH